MVVVVVGLVVVVVRRVVVVVGRVVVVVARVVVVVGVVVVVVGRWVVVVVADVVGGNVISVVLIVLCSVTNVGHIVCEGGVVAPSPPPPISPHFPLTAHG